MLADAAMLMATLLAAVSLLPQAVKLVRTRLPDGVSPTWAALGMATNLGWMTYLTSQGLWPTLPSVVMIIGGYAATFVILHRLGAVSRSAIPVALAWATTLASVAALTGWTGLGTVLGFSYAVQVSPGLWTAYRTRRPGGISPGTWGIALVESLLWGYYGWWNADAPLMIFAVIATASSMAMLARYGATRRRLPGEELTVPAAA